MRRNWIAVLCVGLAIIIFAGLAQAVISATYAKLPDITAAELIEAVKFGDSLHINVDCKYTVDEQFIKGLYGDWMPEKRKLEIHWRKEGIREYIDTTYYDGSPGKPSRFVLALNGKIRMQWQPNDNKGDIFKKPYKHNKPVPIDFGMTLGERDKKLGESLADCEITNIRQEKWQGHECYFVEAIRPDGVKADAWIDPEIGWRARRVRLWNPDGLIRRDASGEFKDCGNGAWFPVEGVFKYYKNDKSSGERVVSIERRLKVEQVKVNADLTQKDFEIQFPRGTRVYVHSRKASYIVGVTSLEGFGEEALYRLVGKALPDMKELGIVTDPNQTKDKMILVCFWDMNQRPSRNCIMLLAKQVEQLKQKGVTIVAVQASKIDENKLDEWVEENNIPFPVGIVQGDEEETRFTWGIRSLPWLILTDRVHIVRDEGFGIDELDEKLKKNIDTEHAIQKNKAMPAKPVAQTGLSEPAKSFLDAEAILAGWESSYAGIRTMRVSYCTRLVDYQPPANNPDIDMTGLIKYQHVERVEDGKRFHIRFSKAEDGFDRPESLMEHAFDGKITREYSAGEKHGSIVAGLIGRNTETMNDLKVYMLLRRRLVGGRNASGTYLIEDPNSKPDLSRTLSYAIPRAMISMLPKLESVGSQLCHVVEVVFPGKDHNGIPRQIKQVFWMAHDKGMCLMKYQWYWDSRLDREIEVEQIAMAKMDGTDVWYPKKAYRTLFNEEVGTMKYELTVKDFVPNVEVDEKTFRFDFPKGTYVFDRVRGIAGIDLPKEPGAEDFRLSELNEKINAITQK